ncbi:hypothetical protein [Nostoc sp. 'Peltigera membranacea cyanobiont' N6]|uniref:hypothetical protein n=1 Tax=Nostoc sp. 'Peltigera membranacea cyanobiont' N6 TaxID=1261031 RepID=UPI000CF340E9|nr:hypothetical protein [Nostoc sp. 'Peltigera membranacea cyanobiont' N6]AVH68280.1 hypothetical protein NPM_100006 [Nostoc sp. 'Peltigera membranacea cyanobiont' N6]
MLGQLSHNSKPSGKYYGVIQFWNRLGLQARKNKESEHLEHFLSFPDQEAIGRVFAVDNWLAVQFHEPVQDISPRLKGSSIQPEVIDPLRIEHFFGDLLAEFLGIPSVAIAALENGFVICTDKLTDKPVSSLIRLKPSGKLEALKGGRN